MLNSAFICCLVFSFFGMGPIQARAKLTPDQMVADFDLLWVTIKNNYCYFDRKHVDWRKVYKVYRPQAEAAGSREEFITVLERTLDELYDPHTTLRVNNPNSTRLIPTGLDLWAEWKDGKAIVTQVRPGFGAEQAGVKVGMIIAAINDVPLTRAVSNRLGCAMTAEDPAARQWALLALLAGRHDTPRTLRVEQRAQPLALDAPGFHHTDDETYNPAVEWRKLENRFGYIRVRDLGSSEVTHLFDDALGELADTQGLILDLRETPRGGNTDVGEHIIGSFVSRTTPYQKIIPPSGRVWLKSARPTPRKKRYTRPVVVLVNRWTGSMGEGIAVGLDGAGRATVVGTGMAGLNGDVYALNLPHSGIGFQFTANKIATVKGVLREEFVPPVNVDLWDAQPHYLGDPILAAGLEALEKEQNPVKGREK